MAIGSSVHLKCYNPAPMEIFLMRHAEAVSAHDHWGGDESRSLTKNAQKLLQKQVPFLQKKNLPVKILLSSPFKRTQLTADLLAPTWPSVKSWVENSLASGARADAFKNVALKYKESAPVFIIGHMPDLIVFVARCLGNPFLIEEAGFAPGELMALETGPLDVRWGEGKILWRKPLEAWETL